MVEMADGDAMITGCVKIVLECVDELKASGVVDKNELADRLPSYVEKKMEEIAKKTEEEFYASLSPELRKRLEEIGNSLPKSVEK